MTNLRRAFDNPLVWPGPVPAAAGNGPDLALVNVNQGAITVMLIRESIPSGGWFRHKRADFRLDEVERGRH